MRGSQKSILWDFETDVVCVGSGIGGLTAAIAAGSKGLKTLVVEKAAAFGGVTAWSGGQIWVPANGHAAAVGIDDTADDAAAYIEAAAGGLGDAILTRNLCVNAAKVLEFLENRGVRVHLIPDLPDYYYPLFAHAKKTGRYVEPDTFSTTMLGDWNSLLLRAPRPGDGGGLGRSTDYATLPGETVGGGEALIGYLGVAARALGTDLWLSSRAAELIAEDDRVVGVRIETPSGSRWVHAKRGVVLATGGYDWNSAFVRRFEGVVDRHASLCPPEITGDHLVMAGQLGAAIYSLPPERGVMMLGVPESDPVTGTGSPSMYLCAGPHEIYVNPQGERFADESFYPSVQGALHRFDGKSHANPNWPVWLIFDDQYLSARARMWAPAPLEKLRISAPTLAELAEKAGIDAEGLTTTVERYNALCAGGFDADFGRGDVPWVRSMLRYPAPESGINPLLGSVEVGPFHAVKMVRLQLGVGVSGLEIDEHAQVMTLAGDPIRGLYAAGNAAGRNDVGMALQSGVANLRGMVHGYLAGTHLSAAN